MSRTIISIENSKQNSFGKYTSICMPYFSCDLSGKDYGFVQSEKAYTGRRLKI